MSDTLILRLQTTLGSAYAVERELGGGGMSRVFLASETSLGRRVVIKVLPPELAATLSTERFKREIQLAARLQHAHIVPLLTAGESDGLPYFTMPYVEGESLRMRLASRGELSVAEGLRVLREIASALAYAHAHGVVHRDIKPENVLLSGGAAMVTDFGVAKALAASTHAEHDGPPSDAVTSRGVALGTPAYMSPEQASADPNVDRRSDLYSLGILAYELLTGHTPFGARTRQALLAAHVTEVPQSIERQRGAIPPAFAALVMRCLEKRPADRPQSADEIVHALDDLTTPSPRTAPAIVTQGRNATPSQERGARPSRPNAGFIATLAVAVMMGVMAVLAWQRTRGKPPIASPAARAVAVMPFENIGSDTSNAYFSDGMTEELMNALDKLPGLHVASRGSAFAFKGKSVDAREIGRQLGVTYIVEGSVRRSRGRLRLSARLVSTANNYEVWAKSYDRDVSDVFAVQDELARAIASELNVSLGGTPATYFMRGTSNVAAYDLYLRGRYLWNHRTASALRQAAQAFSEATRLDPQYALAYAGLGDVYAVSPQYALAPVREYSSRAQAAARRALSLDSTLGEAHATLGYVAELQYRHVDAEREFRVAIAMEPNYATAHHWFAIMLRGQGRAAESQSEIATARHLDPLSPIIATLFPVSLYFRRDFSRAISEYERVLSTDPAFPEANRQLVRVFAAAGDLPRALQAVRRTAVVSGLDESMDLGWVLGLMGRRHEADSVLEVVRRSAVRHYVPPGTFAMIHLGLGNRDSAFVWIGRAVDEFDWAVRDIKIDPRFDALRSDTRYPKILARMHLK